MQQFIQYVYLILIILALVMLANRLRLAYPIVLVLGGLALSFTSAFSHVTIEPESVFFIFLPPLLYEAAWQTSWKEFYKWRRVIMSFAFPIVILTSCVIAFVSYACIPGFTLALGFLLGGIISPPDAISATTIMRNVKVPKAMVSIIEGESLLNDASSLIVFRFAMAAVITGQFHFGEAVGNFFLVIVMGTAIGLAFGYVFYLINRWLPTTASIEIVLTLVAPYCMYYFAEHFHFSGVLAVVSGGLFLSSKRQKMFTYRSRIESGNVWANLTFVLNGVVFLLIGLQLPAITSQMGDISLSSAIGYGLIISLALIITRILCALGASVFTRFMSRFITVADASPGWRNPFIIGWAGMRGVVSLAAALSIPLMATDNQAFPYRNLILFITFIVILITLVFQGLTLPWIIRKLKPVMRQDVIPDHEQEMILQKKIALTSIQYLEQKLQTDGHLSDHLRNLQDRLKIEMQFFTKLLTEKDFTIQNPVKDFQHVYLEMLEQQRKTLQAINHKTEFDEDLIRKYLTLIDMEEFKVREKLNEEG
ncbi:Na+/H+ antiporter [Niastella sp. OAS944]|uniref:Na+/H+ antiporter n=1 Tax=Niastella sp. OAS944 TaxID=2664089 RepID=UPI003475871E|nr:CPA1 family monovalent cation:H+ antiporter [Chitinophagaceae bacterium OAS944]